MSPLRRVVALVATIVLLVTACSDEPSIVEPGPGPDSTTTTTPEADSEVETAEATSTTVLDGTPDGDDVDAEPDTGGQDASDATSLAGTGDTGDTGATEAVIVEDSPNADAWRALADAGLVLTVDEQTCADSTVDDPDGAEIVAAVRRCASATTVDAFSAELLPAGGQSLPPSEASCVSDRLRTDESILGFWEALVADGSFDFLLADRDVQEQYLGLYSSCVSVGRALSDQIGGILSAPTIGCIDELYRDTEFVRTTIEADLSGDATEIARVDQQISGCLNADERAALGRS